MTDAGPAIPILVISLARSIDRRQHITSAFAAIGAQFDWVDAVDGNELADLPALSRHQPHLGRPLTRGEVACLESHLTALTRIVNEHARMACICEDDVRLTDDFAAVLRAIAEDKDPAWDLLLLGHHSARRAPDAGAVTCLSSSALAGRYRVAEVAEFAMGAYAYVVTHRGAERLLRHAHPLRMPMDWVTGYSPVAGVRLFAVTPPCATPEPGLAERTTIPDRHSPPVPPPTVRDRLKFAAGHAWLRARQLGIYPAGYARRY